MKCRIFPQIVEIGRQTTITGYPMVRLMKNENRFDGRSSDYSLYRPDYPHDLLPVIKLEFNLLESATVADIGSGTGKLARLFLENGNRVYGVEPNAEMREQASKDLSSYRNYVTIEGSAENTGLPDNSVDFVVVGQAFHWFDPMETKKEFKRIMTSSGVVILVWNDRVEKNTGINSAYEEICKKYSKGYHATGSLLSSDELISEFFGDDMRKFAVPNPQKMDLDGFKGRYLSASYSLPSTHSKYGTTMRALQKAFKENSKGGYVTMEHITRVFAGHLE